MYTTQYTIQSKLQHKHTQYTTRSTQYTIHDTQNTPYKYKSNHNHLNIKMNNNTQNS